MLLLLIGVTQAGEVDTLFAGASEWMPEDYSAAMRRIESLGSSAVPELATLVGETDDEHRLFALCGALERLGDPRALSALTGKLSHEAWLVRSACGAAYAASVPGGDVAAAEIVWPLIARDAECIVRGNVASDLKHPTAEMCVQYLDWLDSDPCSRQVAMAGLTSCPTDVRPYLMEVLANEREPVSVRESALGALLKLEPSPEAADLYRALARGKPPGNLRTMAIRAMGGVGSAGDLPWLRQILVDEAGTTWSNSAEHAIAEIDRR